MRKLYLVYACYIGSNGGFSSLTGYPKLFDSNSYEGDTEKTLKRAKGEYFGVLRDMCNNDTRQVQEAMIIDVLSGIQIEVSRIGELADVPEPEE